MARESRSIIYSDDENGKRATALRQCSLMEYMENQHLAHPANPATPERPELLTSMNDIPTRTTTRKPRLAVLVNDEGDEKCATITAPGKRSCEATCHSHHRRLFPSLLIFYDDYNRLHQVDGRHCKHDRLRYTGSTGIYSTHYFSGNNGCLGVSGDDERRLAPTVTSHICGTHYGGTNFMPTSGTYSNHSNNTNLTLTCNVFGNSDTIVCKCITRPGPALGFHIYGDRSGQIQEAILYTSSKCQQGSSS